MGKMMGGGRGPMQGPRTGGGSSMNPAMGGPHSPGHSSMFSGSIWCLMPLSTIFQLYRGDQLYWWRKPEYPGKTFELSQVTLFHHYISIFIYV
jgi:hypothetical protein